MPEHMLTLDALWLLVAMAGSCAGTAWIAVSMPVHWEQVRGGEPLPKPAAVLLRAVGASCLATSLALCLRVDHGTMAVLVWIMSLAVAAFLTAMVLGGRPTWMRPLVAWVPRTATDWRRPW